jgi:predicted flap endonuclease-1-like 5' DNA nuclease
MPIKTRDKRDSDSDSDPDDPDELEEELSRELGEEGAESTQSTVEEYADETESIVEEIEETHSERERVEKTLRKHGDDGQSPYRTGYDGDDVEEVAKATEQNRVGTEESSELENPRRPDDERSPSSEGGDEDGAPLTAADWNPSPRESTAKSEQAIRQDGNNTGAIPESPEDARTVASVGEVDEDIIEMVNEDRPGFSGSDVGSRELAGGETIDAGAVFGHSGGQQMVASRSRMQDEGSAHGMTTEEQGSYVDNHQMKDYGGHNPARDGAQAMDVAQGDGALAQEEDAAADTTDQSNQPGSIQVKADQIETGTLAPNNSSVDVSRLETDSGQSVVIVESRNEMTVLDETSMEQVAVEAAVGNREENERLQENAAAAAGFDGSEATVDEAREKRQNLKTESNRNNEVDGGKEEEFNHIKGNTFEWMAKANASDRGRAHQEKSDALAQTRRHDRESDGEAIEGGHGATLDYDRLQEEVDEVVDDIPDLLPQHHPGDSITEVEGIGNKQTQKFEEAGVTEIRDLGDLSADEIQEIGYRITADTAERAAQAGEVAQNVDEQVEDNIRDTVTESLEENIDQKEAFYSDVPPGDLSWDEAEEYGVWTQELSSRMEEQFTKGSSQGLIRRDKASPTPTTTAIGDLEPLQTNKGLDAGEQTSSVGHETVQGEVLQVRDVSDNNGDVWQQFDIRDENGDVTRVTVFEDNLQFNDDLTEPDITNRTQEGRETDLDGEGIDPERDRVVSGDTVKMRNVEVKDTLTSDVMARGDDLYHWEGDYDNNTVAAVPETELFIEDPSTDRDGITEDQKSNVQLEIETGRRDPPDVKRGEEPSPPSYGSDSEGGHSPDYSSLPNSPSNEESGSKTNNRFQSESGTELSQIRWSVANSAGLSTEQTNKLKDVDATSPSDVPEEVINEIDGLDRSHIQDAYEDAESSPEM